MELETIAEPRGVPPLRKLRSQREVLQECEGEAFTHRSLPFMVASVLTLTWALKTKRIVMAEGASEVPLYVGTTVVAFLAGKFSYRMICARKIMELSAELDAKREVDRTDYAQYLPREEQQRLGSAEGSNEPTLDLEAGTSTQVLDGNTSRKPTATNRYGDRWS